MAPRLASVVSGLTSGRGGVAGNQLIPYGIRYVVADSGGRAPAAELAPGLLAPGP